MLERTRRFYYALRSAFSTLSKPRRWLVDMFGGSKSKAGAEVSKDTAVQVVAVFACIRILAQTIASLPLHTYRRLPDGGKEKATDHPLYFLLHSLPNPECTSYNFRLITMVNLLLTGHAFAEIQWGRGSGAVEALWPIPSNRVYVKRNRQTQEIYYEVTLRDGGVARLGSEKMLHIQWIGMENFRTFSPVALAREAIGLSIAAEEFGARFFESGAVAAGIAEYPGKLKDESFDRFKKSFMDKYTTIDKGQRIMFLEEGLKFTKLTVNPNEAQMLETRKFQVIEVARFYNVPPHMIMDLERSTFSNIEHQDIGFVKYSLRPYLVCWEQEILRSLIMPGDRRKYFSEFNVEGLLRGDTLSRAEYYTKMFNIGVFSQNDIRTKENENPFEGGNKHYVPLNMIAIEDEGFADPFGFGREQPPSLEEKRARQKKSAKEKLRTANSFLSVFKDAAERIVNRETKDIKRKAKSTLIDDKQAEFAAWLEDYYEKAPVWMQKTLKPALLSYMDTIGSQAAKEANSKASLSNPDQWADGYLTIWSRRHINSSKGQIQNIIKQANEDGTDVIEELEARLDEWEERRPEKIASNEVIEAAGAISKAVYIAAGIRYLRWENTSGNPCPYCDELDGRTVGIDQAFVGYGDKLDSDDGSMNIYSPALTPPLHQGCQCMIVPD